MYLHASPPAKTRLWIESLDALEEGALRGMPSHASRVNGRMKSLFIYLKGAMDCPEDKGKIANDIRSYPYGPLSFCDSRNAFAADLVTLNALCLAFDSCRAVHDKAHATSHAARPASMFILPVMLDVAGAIYASWQEAAEGCEKIARARTCLLEESRPFLRRLANPHDSMMNYGEDVFGKACDVLFSVPRSAFISRRKDRLLERHFA